jgi:hypothetical protein
VKDELKQREAHITNLNKKISDLERKIDEGKKDFEELKDREN